MMNQIQKLMSETGQPWADQMHKFRKEFPETVREAVTGSAETLKSLKSPVRLIARSGIKLTTVSQATVQSLIELQSDMITSALSDAALRLERASRADTVVDLVRDQIELLPATRERLTEEANRAVSILKDAGREIRTVATHAYAKVVESAEAEVPAAKTARRKGKRAVRKTVARARKVAVA